MSLSPRAGGPPLPGGPYGQYGLVALWVEAIIYGLYLPLSVGAFNIMRKRPDRRTPTARFLSGGLILMFIFISLSAVITLVTMLKIYVPSATAAPRESGPPSPGVLPPMPWDVYLFIVILTVLEWIVATTMILRVFLVWGRNFYIIIPPCCVLAVGVASGLFNFWYSLNFPKFDPHKAQIIRGLSFPMSLTNSILTTSLISYRIWVQHRRNSAASVSVSRGTSLVLVLRIIVESAMIWTVQMIINAVLFFIDHKSQVVAKHASIPSSGIVLALITIRTQSARSSHSSTTMSAASKSREYVSSFLLPGWLMKGGHTSSTIISRARTGDTESELGNTANKLSTEHKTSYISYQGPTKAAAVHQSVRSDLQVQTPPMPLR